MKRLLIPGLRTARRIVVAVIGTTIVLLGLALLVLPGPAFVVLPVGLSVLALEFEFARRWLRRVREFYASTMERTRKTREPDGPIDAAREIESE